MGGWVARMQEGCSSSRNRQFIADHPTAAPHRSTPPPTVPAPHTPLDHLVSCTHPMSRVSPPGTQRARCRLPRWLPGWGRAATTRKLARKVPAWRRSGVTRAAEMFPSSACRGQEAESGERPGSLWERWWWQGWGMDREGRGRQAGGRENPQRHAGKLLPPALPKPACPASTQACPAHTCRVGGSM